MPDTFRIYTVTKVEKRSATTKSFTNIRDAEKYYYEQMGSSTSSTPAVLFRVTWVDTSGLLPVVEEEEGPFDDVFADPVAEDPDPDAFLDRPSL